MIATTDREPFDSVPTSLRGSVRWVCWKYVTRPGQDEPTKVPIDATTNREASTTDSATWTSFEVAHAAFRRDPGLHGIGFVFADGDGYVGIDIDGCIAEGAVFGSAQELIDLFDSYAEVSPSGTGVKIFIKAMKNCSKCKSRAIDGIKQVEVYSKARYFTVTGRHLPNTPLEVNERQEALDELCAHLWPTRKTPRKPAAPPGRPALDDDDELLAQARSARNGAKFSALWQGDTSLHAGDESAADLALCALLAFWTACDAARIDRLFRRSGLLRDKWDERRGDQTYGEMTIATAIEGRTECYGSRGSQGARPRDDADESDTRVFTEVDIEALLGKRDVVTGKLVLSPQRTLFAAEAFVDEFHRRSDGRTLVACGEEFLEWRDNRYVPIAPEALSQRLQAWLHEALQPKSTKVGIVLVPFGGRPSTVNPVLQSILWYVQLQSRAIAPFWIDGRTDGFDAAELLPCRTANLHVPSGAVIPATPALFVRTALDFDYDPNAAPPGRWLQFLEELFGDDREAIELLQEWFGYCLLRDTSLQKALLLVGPRRSGKGTIARVLTRLLGAENVAAPTAGSLTGNFGLQPVADKSLAIVSDARISGPHASTLIERVLCISGEDSIVVDKKYRDPVTARLAARIMILSNELPQLADASGAIAGRFIILQLTRSFFDREDPTLEGQLAGELPGILLWALEGLRRLRPRGRFVQPASSQDAVHEFEDLSSPLSAFARDECTVGAGKRVTVDGFFKTWKRWCADMNIDAGGKATLGRIMRAAFPKVKRRRGTEPFYDGIGLREEQA